MIAGVYFYKGECKVDYCQMCWDDKFKKHSLSLYVAISSGVRAESFEFCKRIYSHNTPFSSVYYGKNGLIKVCLSEYFENF
jgi:hypothetical protein